MLPEHTAFARDERDRLIRVETLLGVMAMDIEEIKGALLRSDDRAEQRQETQVERSFSNMKALATVLGSGALSFAFAHLKF